MAKTKVDPQIIADAEKVSYVVKKFDESKKYYDPLRRKWEEWDDMYFGIPKPKNYDWQSNLFIPATFKAVMTLLCRIINILFGTTPPFDVLPVEPTDRAGGELVKSLLNFQFEGAEVFNKFNLMVLQALVRGTSIGKIWWKKETEMKKFNEPIKNWLGITTGYNAVSRQVVTYDDPAFEVIDLLDYYPDPKTTKIGEGDAVHKTIRSFDYLKKREAEGVYKNVDQLRITAFPGQSLEKSRRLLNIGMTERQTQANVHKKKEEKEQLKIEGSADVELLEFEGKYDINNDGLMEDVLFTVGNRKVILRAIENPYWHGESSYFSIIFLPLLNEPYGQGIPEIIEPLQAELNDKHNQRMDNVNLSLQQVLTYVEGAIDPLVFANFQFKPGAKLPVKMLNAIKWEITPNYTQTYIPETEIVERHIEEVTGATKSIMPSAGGKDIHRTASGLAMLQGMAGERIKMVVKLMESMGIKKLVGRFHQLNQQFVTMDRTIRILGAKGAEYPKVSPMEIGKNYDFIPAGSTSIANKEIQLMQLLQFLNISGNFQGINVAAILKKIWAAMGFDHVEEVLLGTEEAVTPAVKGGVEAGREATAPSGEEEAMIREMVRRGVSIEDIQGRITGEIPAQ